MKFFTYAALVFGASAISLRQMTTSDVAVAEQALATDPWEDVGKGVEAELAKDGDLTLKEFMGVVKKVAKKYKYKLTKQDKEMVKQVFDYVDANDDGKVTGEEIEAVMKEHPEDDEDVEVEGPKKDFKDAVEAELKKDGSLELDELYDIIKELAKKYKHKLPEGWKEGVKKIFDWVDADHDGHVTGEEIEAAMKKLKKMKKKGKKAPKDDEEVQVEGPWEDVGKGVEAELKKDGDLTLKEFKGVVKKVAKKYKYKLTKDDMEMVKKIFDYVDANDDGKVTGAEIEAAMKKHPEDDEDVEVEGPGEDFKAAVEAELAKDGSITLDELYGIIKGLAKKYKYKLPKGWEGYIKKIFDWVDANDDGEVTGEEIEAAMKHEE